MAVTSSVVETTVTQMNKVEDVYYRVALYRATTNIPYTQIADAAGISRNVMGKLTSKDRRMTEANLNKLVTYLESVGF
jgi:hypothetical protein